MNVLEFAQMYKAANIDPRHAVSTEEDAKALGYGTQPPSFLRRAGNFVSDNKGVLSSAGIGAGVGALAAAIAARKKRRNQILNWMLLGALGGGGLGAGGYYGYNKLQGRGKQKSLPPIPESALGQPPKSVPLFYPADAVNADIANYDTGYPLFYQGVSGK